MTQPRRIKYVTHPYGGDPRNLVLAAEHVARLNASAPADVLYIAPWIGWAKLQAAPGSTWSEADSWRMIEFHIAAKETAAIAHIVYEGMPLSPGQCREEGLAQKYGKAFEVDIVKKKDAA
jgi:hypothetical protein